MAKLTDAKFTIKGISNREYEFNMYSLDTNFKSIGGIYIFTNRYKTANVFYHNIIYCGKTEDLSTRFNDHHKTSCIKNNGSNCICIMVVNTEIERTNIEKDILLANTFTCNEVLNK